MIKNVFTDVLDNSGDDWQLHREVLELSCLIGRF